MIQTKGRTPYKERKMKRRDFCKSIALGSVALSQFKPLSLLANQKGLNRTFYVTNKIHEWPKDYILEGMKEIRSFKISSDEYLMGLMIAANKNISPWYGERPGLGREYHSIMVLHAVKTANDYSPESEKWLRLAWATDFYKTSYENFVAAKSQTFKKIPFSTLPDKNQAMSFFHNAMENWDQEAAQIGGMAIYRHFDFETVVEAFIPYAIRDLRQIGHKTIALANMIRILKGAPKIYGYSTMQNISASLLVHKGDNPKNTPDSKWDRAWYETEKRAQQMQHHWKLGTVKEYLTKQMVQNFDKNTAQYWLNRVTDAVNDPEIHPQTYWDAFFVCASMLNMRYKGELVSIHAVTSMDAFYELYRHSYDDHMKRKIFIQALARLLEFRDYVPTRGVMPYSVEEAFEIEDYRLKLNSSDPRQFFDFDETNAIQMGSRAYRYFETDRNRRAFTRHARAHILQKMYGNHNLKHSEAVFMNLKNISFKWRPLFLAAALTTFKPANHPDNEFVKKARQELT